MSESEGNLSAAQLRARKRQEKIKASASQRINKITVTARGENGAEYLKTDTPFNRPSQSIPTDPDDIDLSIASTQSRDPSSGFIPPLAHAGSEQGDLASLMSSMMGNNGPSDTQLPPELADNPLFAALQNMTGAGGPAEGFQQQQQMQETRPKSLAEKLLPLVHLLSMVALLSWTVWNTSSATEWHVLARRRSAKELLQDMIGFGRPLPLLYAFVTVQLVLQSLQIVMTKNTPPAPSMISYVLPMLPPQIGLWVRTSVKYYALLGTILDDLSVLLVGIGLFVAIATWRAES